MARVLGVRASLWLLDEPFTNLDAAGSETFAALITAHVSGGGMAVVVAHHELVMPIEARRLELPG
jgi:heme exporter protein A